MKKYYPDRRSMNVLRTAAAVLGFVLIALTRIFIPLRAVMLALSIIFAVLTLLTVFIYLPIYFSRLEYTSDEHEITKISGVFYRSVKSIKYNSIQYASHAYIPIVKKIGFNFIVFYVFGGKMLLLFLSRKDAEEIFRTADKRSRMRGGGNIVS